MGMLVETPLQWVHLVDGLSITAVVVGVAKTFEWLDGMISDSGREALSKQFKAITFSANVSAWPDVFSGLIDRVFGKRAWSLRFVMVSCISSLLAVFILALICLRLMEGPDEVISDLQESWMYFALAGAINFIPDYLSLLLSRAIIRQIATRPTVLRIGIWLLVDTVATGILSLCAQVPIVAAVYLAIPDNYPLSHPFWRAIDWSDLNPSEIFHGELSLCFYSAFFTSVWLWLYVVSVGVIRLFNRILATWTGVSSFLDIEKRPLVAVGRIAGLIAGAAYAAILGYEWLTEHWH